MVACLYVLFLPRSPAGYLLMVLNYLVQVKTLSK
uniref:Uncharacterized protein n=1 Tax=Rhizophora mucronata TaxID=61149 RepID=A0A2P2Q7K3_RHIMU